mgnify:CR=1 FL=1
MQYRQQRHSNSLYAHLIILHEGALYACLLPKLIQYHSNPMPVLLFKDVFHQSGLQDSRKARGCSEHMEFFVLEGALLHMSPLPNLFT